MAHIVLSPLAAILFFPPISQTFYLLVYAWTLSELLNNTFFGKTNYGKVSLKIILIIFKYFYLIPNY